MQPFLFQRLPSSPPLKYFRPRKWHILHVLFYVQNILLLTFCLANSGSRFGQKPSQLQSPGASPTAHYWALLTAFPVALSWRGQGPTPWSSLRSSRDPARALPRAEWKTGSWLCAPLSWCNPGARPGEGHPARPASAAGRQAGAGTGKRLRTASGKGGAGTTKRGVWDLPETPKKTKPKRLRAGLD